MPETTEASQTQTQTQTTTQNEVKFETAMHVPTELQGEAYFKTFEGKPLGEVLKSGLEAHKLVGSSVRIPTAEAKPEEWDGFYAKLPRPTNAEGYKSPFSEDFAKKHAPEGLVKGVFKAAYEVGMSQRQVDHVLKAFEVERTAVDVNEKRELQLLSDTSKEKIKARYGDNYSKAEAMASRAAKRFGGTAIEGLIKDYNLASDPVFFDTFYNISQLITEDSWVGGENKPAAVITKDEAKSRIAAIYADKTHPYHNPQAGSYLGAKAEVDRLRKIQYGD